MSALRSYASTGPLTTRHVQILRLKAQGLTNQQVGAELHIAASTVHAELSSAYARLQVRNVTAAVAVAIRRGEL